MKKNSENKEEKTATWMTAMNIRSVTNLFATAGKSSNLVIQDKNFYVPCFTLLFINIYNGYRL